MARFIEVKPTWGFQILASNILLVLTHSCSESSSCKSYIFTFRKLLTVWLFTSPVVDTVFRFECNSICYIVAVSSDKPCHLGSRVFKAYQRFSGSFKIFSFFKVFQGLFPWFSRVFRVFPGFSWLLKVFKDFSGVSSFFSGVFRVFHGFSRFFKIS